MTTLTIETHAWAHHSKYAIDAIPMEGALPISMRLKLTPYACGFIQGIAESWSWPGTKCSLKLPGELDAAYTVSTLPKQIADETDPAFLDSRIYLEDGTLILSLSNPEIYVQGELKISRLKQIVTDWNFGNTRVTI